ncbi:MAG: haloacid dehalogenase type II [Kiloniellales bacterium]
MSEPAFSDIGACVFDAYGTLFDVHSAVARGGAALGDKAEAASALWRQKQLEYTWLRSLMGVHADFWQVTGDGLDYALAAQGVDDPALRDRLMQLYLTLDAYPDALACLEALRAAGKTTAILSNGSPTMLNAATESAGLGAHLDAVLSVEDAGIYKPDARVYRLAVERLRVQPERVCFVSANGWDAAGAAHFGFRVAWLNRFAQATERLPGAPAAVIDSLAALPGLLDL